MTTLYDDTPILSMKPLLSTLDQSQLADLEHQLQTPDFDSWLSDELPSARVDDGGRPMPLQLPVNPVVPLVVEAKAAEDDDERDARLPPSRRRAPERLPFAPPPPSSSQSPHQPAGRPPNAFNPAAAGGPSRLPATSGYLRQTPSFVPLSVCVPKDEPQTVPTCGVGGGIDAQKTARKRERNRLAAQRCRHRKLEQIGMLQERVEKLNAVKLELERTADALRRKLGVISHLYQQHVDSGCPLTPLRPACTSANAVHL